MPKLNFRIKHVKLAFAILLILAFAVFVLYYTLILNPLSQKISFANQMIEISDENENIVFSIQKILLFNSALAIDHSDNLSLQNLSISQYSDLFIYLDNSQSSSEITPDTTIKELYIDNISISTASDMGNKILNYKNPSNSGKFMDLEKPSNSRIDFKIINKNEDNENTDYDQPTFYTDCSNPISLGFLNKDFLVNYSVANESQTITFNNAKVLGETEVNLEDLNYNLKFTIHIVNNNNKKFAYNMSFDVNLSDDAESLIANGSSYHTISTSSNEYRFLNEVN